MGPCRVALCCQVCDKICTPEFASGLPAMERRIVLFPGAFVMMMMMVSGVPPKTIRNIITATEI